MFHIHVASVCPKCFICFQTYVAIIFYLDVAYVFTHMLQQYVPNVSVVSILCCNKCFFMLQWFYLVVVYVSHTCCMRMSQIFHLCQLYVAFECFMLEVQTADVGVHEGRQGQPTATEAWRRRRPLPTVWGGSTGRAMLLWKRRGRVIRAAWAADLKWAVRIGCESI